jgi:hypothetical protein
MRRILDRFAQDRLGTRRWRAPPEDPGGPELQESELGVVRRFVAPFRPLWAAEPTCRRVGHDRLIVIRSGQSRIPLTCSNRLLAGNIARHRPGDTWDAGRSGR